MNPSRRLLYALAAVLCLGLLLGTAAALESAVPSAIHTAWWGLLLCLGLVATLDALHLHRLPSPELRRVLAGNLALGRWHEVQLEIRHPMAHAMRAEVFDHVPAGLDMQALPQQLLLHAQQFCQLSYRLQPARRGHFHFEHCYIRLFSPLGLWRERRLLPLPSQTRVYPDFTQLHGAPLMAVDRWLSRLGVRQQPRRGLGMDFHQYAASTMATPCGKSTGRPRRATARPSSGSIRTIGTSRSY